MFTVVLWSCEKCAFTVYVYRSQWSITESSIYHLDLLVSPQNHLPARCTKALSIRSVWHYPLVPIDLLKDWNLPCPPESFLISPLLPSPPLPIHSSALPILSSTLISSSDKKYHSVSNISWSGNRSHLKGNRLWLMILRKYSPGPQANSSMKGNSGRG